MKLKGGNECFCASGGHLLPAVISVPVAAVALKSHAQILDAQQRNFYTRDKQSSNTLL